jgi:negative regulator of sigma E activity
MLTKTTITLGTALLLCGSVSLSSVAQTTGAQPPTATQPAPDTQKSGTTSGPSSGSPTTLGTTGTTTGTPHQLESVQDQSSSIKRETEQGSGSTQQPTSQGTGQPGSSGTESGPVPKE